MNKKGHPAWNKGKKGVYSEEALAKMRASSPNIGKKPLNWKGGSWVYWRAEILKRDQACVLCGESEKRILEVAHIIPIKGLKNRVSSGHTLNTYTNLVTLCPNCHKRIDTGILKKSIIKKYAKRPQ